VHFRQGLRDIRYELEAMLDGLGAQCLPYPVKGATIRDLVKWFQEEVKSLGCSCTCGSAKDAP
jgi:hypothetical protein